MKTPGIIGGIAPESTIDYYRQIIAVFREHKQDGNYPPILINSINMTKMLELIGTNRLVEVAAYLAGEVGRLAAAGADFALLASNTPHIVFNEVQQQSPIPLISIVEAACQTAASLGLRKVGLFGTRFTMEGGFYQQVFAPAGIQVVTPEAAEREFIHAKYMGELVNGVFLDETRRQLLSIVDHLMAVQGIQGLVLGGTELPLILRDDGGRGIPFLDTTRIHVAQVVARMLEA